MPTVEEAHAAEPYCYLTTQGRRSGAPREIEIWFVAAGDTIYLLNGGGRRPPGESHWVLNLCAQPAARVRIAGDEYAGIARVVERGSEEHERARAALVAKYEQTPGELADWRERGFPVAIELRADPRPTR